MQNFKNVIIIETDRLENEFKYKSLLDTIMMVILYVTSTSFAEMHYPYPTSIKH